MPAQETAQRSSVKCACQSCQCRVLPAKAVERDGKLYCSQACAFECTETTCVCVHERCGDDGRH
jgi:hypothetical protein